MAYITHYMAHDPISNTEGVITEYDQDTLRKAADSGIVFIAVDSDGARSVVTAEEIKQPENKDESFVIVQPSYVDDRIQAVINVFDTLEGTMFPTVEASSSTDMLSASAVRKAPKISPEAAFKNALAALKDIALGDDAQ